MEKLVQLTNLNKEQDFLKMTNQERQELMMIIYDHIQYQMLNLEEEEKEFFINKFDLVSVLTYNLK